MRCTKPMLKVWCPGCARRLPVRNTGCHQCGYEDPVNGRIMRLADYLTENNLVLNNVCGEYLRKLVEAAQHLSEGNP